MVKALVGLVLATASVNAHAGGILDWFRAIGDRCSTYADGCKVNQPPVEINPRTARCGINEDGRTELRDGGRLIQVFNARAKPDLQEKIYLLCGQAILRAQKNIAPGERTIKIKWVEFVNDKQYWATEDEKKPMVVDGADLETVASPFSSTRQIVAIKGIPAFALNYKFAREVKFESPAKEKGYLCDMLGAGCGVTQAQEPTAVTASASH